MLIVLSGKHSDKLIFVGSYIYFYKSRRDLMPVHYIYISDCKISSKLDVQLSAAIQGNLGMPANDFENALFVSDSCKF